MHEVVYLNEKKVQPSTWETEEDMENLWYLDNGASNHMSGNRLFFYKLDESVTEVVRFGDDSRINIKGKGSIKFILKGGEKKTLNNLYYIPGLRSNIVSLGQATEAGCEVRMKDDILMLFDRTGELMIKTSRSRNRLYKVNVKADFIRCLQAAKTSDSSRWHARLGHVNVETMKTMIIKELVTGLLDIIVEKETCVSCLLGKQTRRSFPQATSYRATHLLELIHGDLCGPITLATPGQKRYVFVLIDDFSRYMWTILLNTKSEEFSKFKTFKNLVEQETKAKVKTFRSDRGGEFLSHEFKAYFDTHGINRHTTAPYSPQQNGVVERRNRTLMEMTRSLLKHMGVPNYLWGEAVRNATYLINRVATRSLQGLTPYEALRSKKPNIGHLKVFGCVCATQGQSSQEGRSLMIGLGFWCIWELSQGRRLTVYLTHIVRRL